MERAESENLQQTRTTYARGIELMPHYWEANASNNVPYRLFPALVLDVYDENRQIVLFLPD